MGTELGNIVIQCNEERTLTPQKQINGKHLSCIEKLTYVNLKCSNRAIRCILMSSQKRISIMESLKWVLKENINCVAKYFLKI